MGQAAIQQERCGFGPDPAYRILADQERAELRRVAAVAGLDVAEQCHRAAAPVDKPFDRAI
jgi:hypothetical protein